MALLIAVPSARADLPDTVARIKPSVVVVGTFRATDSPRFRMRGTGFVVADGNHAVTNAHVLPEATENMAGMTVVVQVRRPGGDLSMRQATVLQVDRVHDLALMRFEGAAAPAMQVGDSSAVREGQAVAFMGFPIGGALGFSSVTHRALISSITPAAMPTPTARQLNAATIRSVRAGPFDIFQLDGTAYPGNSGGPLFDPESGVVLGVVNMVFIKGSRESALSQPSGISYAIPSRFVAELIEDGLRK
ncbi:MAG: trypsin-like peptidase domain-containing protein [Rhodoferax sp.]|nr:trypsin-like peptidase domain-containing protein [Rhodoferax sp.]